MVEVRVHTPVASYGALQRGPQFDAMVQAGFDATSKAILGPHSVAQLR
jgi:hypothetical protein